MFNLKPCPFCGGNASYSQTGTGYDFNSVFLDFRISCNKCGAVAPGSRGRMKMKLDSDGKLSVFEDGRVAAEEAWGRRADE